MRQKSWGVLQAIILVGVGCGTIGGLSVLQSPSQHSSRDRLSPLHAGRLGGVAHAEGQYTGNCDCVVGTLPWTANTTTCPSTAPAGVGLVCLTKTIVWNPGVGGNAITIALNGPVTLDLGGYSLICTGSNCGSSTGILLDSGGAGTVYNLAVQNGSVGNFSQNVSITNHAQYIRLKDLFLTGGTNGIITTATGNSYVEVMGSTIT